MESEELPRHSVFRPLVENIRTDIGVSALVFHVDTETGREFKYLDAISEATQPKARRMSRLDAQMNDARNTGGFRTRHNSVAFSGEQAGPIKVTGGHHAAIDRFGANTMFLPNAAESKEARRRVRARKRKGQLQRGEEALRDDLKMYPPVHKILPIKLLRKFDSEQPDLAPRRRARPKVLIVDGNRIHLGACHAVYEKYFEIVQCVPTADQAMDLLDHVVFDIVLVAPDLPGELSGLDLVDAIRNVEEKSRHVFRCLVIAILTPAQGRDQTLLDACFCSGMDRFLVKPAVMYVHLLCDLMVGGSSSDAFRRLALETQWVSNHDAMLHVLGEDANACASIIRIMDAEGTEEVRQREVAALMETDTDRHQVDGLHERQRREELQRIVNATAQMKRRIIDLENEVEVLEEERARRAYTESRNLHTLLALETRLKEAEHELHEKSREAQQLRNKSEEYRIDLKNLLDNGCVNAEQVAKAKLRVRHYQKLVEACETTAMSRLDASDQRKWSNYYGDTTHRSHFEVDEFAPKFATDTSASWYRSELDFLGTGVGAAMQSIERAFDDMKAKMHRCMMTEQFDRDAVINVVRDQLLVASRSFSNDIVSLKRAVGDTVANVLLRELRFWKMLEDDEPKLLQEFGKITAYLESLRSHLEDRSHATQTDAFPWDQQTTKDLENISVEMMGVSVGDAGMAVLMENSYPKLPDGSYNAESHAQAEVFRLPVHQQQGLLDVPQLRILNPLLPLTRGDVFMQEKSRRIVFGSVFERLHDVFSGDKQRHTSTVDLIKRVVCRLHHGVAPDVVNTNDLDVLGELLSTAADNAAKIVEESHEAKAVTRSVACSPTDFTLSPTTGSPATASVSAPSSSTGSKKAPTPSPPGKRSSKGTPSSTSSPQAPQLAAKKAPNTPSKPTVHNAPLSQSPSGTSRTDVPLGSTPSQNRRFSSISASTDRRVSTISATERRISVAPGVARPHRSSTTSVLSSDMSAEVDDTIPDAFDTDRSANSLELNPPTNEALQEALAAVKVLREDVEGAAFAAETWRTHLWASRIQLLELLFESRCLASAQMFDKAVSDRNQAAGALREISVAREHFAKESKAMLAAKDAEHAKALAKLQSESLVELERLVMQTSRSTANAQQNNAALHAAPLSNVEDRSSARPQFQANDKQQSIQQYDARAELVDEVPHDTSRRKRGAADRKAHFNVAVAGVHTKSDGPLQVGTGPSEVGPKQTTPRLTETNAAVYHQETSSTPSMQMSSFIPVPPSRDSPRERVRGANNVAHESYSGTAYTAHDVSKATNDHFLPLLPGRNAERIKTGDGRVFQGLLSQVVPSDDESTTIMMTTSFPTKKKQQIDQHREKALADAFGRYHNHSQPQATSSNAELQISKHTTNHPGGHSLKQPPKTSPRTQQAPSPATSPMLHVGNYVVVAQQRSESPSRGRGHVTRSPLPTRPPLHLDTDSPLLPPTPQKAAAPQSSERQNGARHEQLASLMS